MAAKLSASFSLFERRLKLSHQSDRSMIMTSAASKAARMGHITKPPRTKKSTATLANIKFIRIPLLVQFKSNRDFVKAHRTRFEAPAHPDRSNRFVVQERPGRGRYSFRGQ